MTNKILILSILFFVLGCNSSKTKEIPMDRFVGKWELAGRTMFENMVIEISKDSGSSIYKGVLVKLNNHKLIKLFVDSGDTWVSKISRKSNFQFKIKEKKIASALFSVYGISTSTSFNAQFIDENTIGLSADKNPLKSKIIYKRIKN